MRIIKLLLLFLIAQISLSCSKAELNINYKGLLSSDQTAGPNFSNNGGAAYLTNGSFKLKAQVQAIPRTQLANSSFKLHGQAVIQ
jgi:hypothetical protein